MTPSAISNEIQDRSRQLWPLSCYFMSAPNVQNFPNWQRHILAFCSLVSSDVSSKYDHQDQKLRDLPRRLSFF